MILAIIGAASIVYFSYTYISKNINSNESVEVNSPDFKTLTESEKTRIWFEDGERLAAQYSQRLVENEIKDNRFTASSMIPVHHIFAGQYLVDGILKTHDGTGRYLNYSCKVTCYVNEDPRDEKNWFCCELFVNGEKITTSFESKAGKEKYGK